ncbi:hypothetical protein Golax_011679 [Gossypium laxum]|uniref:Uncharacterized protein n=1 Tax=Gossypium laxum TaxID=34288 RepID=A0A7J8ZLU0_9ROSI|nr:hypothetical protein [Gossypium laxum]
MDTTSHAFEQPGSSILSEMERATKKVWSKDLNENSPRDLTMEDFNKGKKSFKEILMVNVGKKGGCTYAILKNEDLEIVEEYLRFLLEGLYPKIFFSDRVQEILDKNMEQTLVVKLLGRLIGYKALLN